MGIRFLVLFLLSSCSLMMGSKAPKSAKDTQYKIKFNDEAWVANNKSEERSDYIWTNKEDGRILLSNSFCNEFQDQTLKDLATKTFNSVDKIQIENQDYTTFENREAYRLQGKGSVDGVSVSLILLNTRRNKCYFDFVSITPLPSPKTESSDFDQFLKSVSFK